MMGEVLREFPPYLVISSKLFGRRATIPMIGVLRKHIMESIDRSLQRIGVDYLDLYFCHRWDEHTPLLETIRAMDDLIHRGKILYWGTSEWTGAQIQQACDLAEKYHLYPPQVEQPQYNMLVRDRFEKEVAPAAQKNGMGLVVWSPLASGLLTGKYDDGVPAGTRLADINWLREEVLSEERLAKVRSLKMVAGTLNVTRAQLAMAWALHHPAVSSVITGATRVEQLVENLGASTVELTPDILAQIDQILAPVAAA
jgi:aryl-alcohol dehydrogenase-like predicted oxidoreductase